MVDQVYLSSAECSPECQMAWTHKAVVVPPLPAAEQVCAHAACSSQTVCSVGQRSADHLQATGPCCSSVPASPLVPHFSGQQGPAPLPRRTAAALSMGSPTVSEDFEIPAQVYAGVREHRLALPQHTIHPFLTSQQSNGTSSPPR